VDVVDVVVGVGGVGGVGGTGTVGVVVGVGGTGGSGVVGVVGVGGVGGSGVVGVVGEVGVGGGVGAAGANDAFTHCGVSVIVTVQVSPETTSHLVSPHPVNFEPGLGTAVIFTFWSVGNLRLQLVSPHASVPSGKVIFPKPRGVMVPGAGRKLISVVMRPVPLGE
jgi:hypothetical protein